MARNINRVRPQGVILNHGIWRHGLSMKALGLLYILMDLSQLPDWEFSCAGLTALAAQHGMGDGRDSIRSGIAELESKGFLQRQRERGSDGTLAGTQWLVSDEPFDQQAAPASDQPTSDFPTLAQRPQEGSSSIEEERQKKTPVCPQLPGLADAAETAAQPIGKPRKRRKITGADVGPSTFAEFGQEAATVLLDWWHNHKGGAKTDLALQLQMGELRQIQAMGGNALVQSQAELAIRSGVMRGKGWSQINAAKCRDYGSGNHARQPHGGQQAVLPSQELLDIASLAEAHPRLFSSAVVTGGAVELTYTALVRARFGYPEKSRVTMEEAIKAEVEALENRLQAEAEQAAVTPF